MRKKLTVWISALLFTASIFGSAAQHLNMQTAQAATEPTTIEYDFTDESQMRDFTEVFVGTESGTGGTVGAFGDYGYFTLNTAQGKVTSQRQGSGSGSTNSITSLVLNKYTFKNFEAEVEMDFEGDSSWGWGGLQFRKTVLNTGWRADGCFGFVQMQGHATIWGADAFDGETFEAKASSGFSKNSKFLLTVRTVEKDCTVTVSNLDKTKEYAKIEHTFEKNESLVDGFVALQSVDNSHNFYSLKVTNLDANGNPIALKRNESATEITLDKSMTSIEVGTPTQVGYEVDGKLDTNTLAWSVNDPSVAVVKNGWVTGLKQGTVTISVASMVNPVVRDSVTLTIGEKGEKMHVFDNDDDINAMTAAYVAFKADPNGGDEAFANHWTKTNNGTIKRSNLTTSEANDENFAYLYDKSMTYKNFEATLVYRNSNDAFGWIGISSGSQIYNERCIDQGLGCFVQREGYPTTWGGDLGTVEERIAYGVTDWHVLRVRVFGQTIQMFIDDMSTPVLTRACGRDFAEGFVGIMTTCRAEFEIAAFGVKMLDAQGNVLDLSGVKSVAFTEKPATATVGEKLTLSISVEGTSAIPLSYEFVTSDDNVAFINNGVLYFISDGEVTISVVCPSESRLTDSFTITVSKAAAGDKDYYYPTLPDSSDSSSTVDSNSSSSVTQAPNNDGCGSAITAVPVFALLTVLGLGVTAQRRKQQ